MAQQLPDDPECHQGLPEAADSVGKLLEVSCHKYETNGRYDECMADVLTDKHFSVSAVAHQQTVQHPKSGYSSRDVTYG